MGAAEQTIGESDEGGKAGGPDETQLGTGRVTNSGPAVTRY